MNCKGFNNQSIFIFIYFLCMRCVVYALSVLAFCFHIVSISVCYAFLLLLLFGYLFFATVAYAVQISVCWRFVAAILFFFYPWLT